MLKLNLSFISLLIFAILLLVLHNLIAVRRTGLILNEISQVNEKLVARETPTELRDKQASRNSIGVYGVDNCEKKDRFFFLKTSKTGSTAITHMLMRRAYQMMHPVNVLSGADLGGSFWGEVAALPFTTDACYLGKGLDIKFDISYAHNIYNKTAVDSLMHDNTVKLTILRDPLDNFQSSWSYYSKLISDIRDELAIPHLNNKPDFITEMETFLENPFSYLNQFAYDHSTWMFTFNPQFLFFGKPSYLLHDETKLGRLVGRWVDAIDREFDHVIILEMLPESLAVLMLKMCWSVDDMVVLKLNMALRSNDKTINQRAKKNLQKMNWADFKLYNHFKKRLEREIRELGLLDNMRQI